MSDSVTRVDIARFADAMRAAERATVRRWIVVGIAVWAILVACTSAFGPAGIAIGLLGSLSVYFVSRLYKRLTIDRLRLAASNAWFDENFGSDPVRVFEALDTEYLLEVARASRAKPENVSATITARFPALGGGVLRQIAISAVDSPSVLGAGAGSRATQTYPDVDSGTVTARARELPTARLGRIRQLLSIAAPTLIALALVPVFVFDLFGDPDRLPLVLLVSLPFASLGIGCYAVLGNVVIPAIAPAGYREKYDASPARVFEEAGRVLPADIATPAVGQPIAPTVLAIRTALPWLPLWDAVAIVRLAQGRSAATV